jgi:chemotaxis protein methyltransferase CheR
MTPRAGLGGDAASMALGLADFDRVAGFVHQLAGIKMPRAKHAMVEARLRRRVAATGAASFAEYCARVLDEGGDGPETVQLVNALTTNKTDFFREPEHFRILAEQVLPGLWLPHRRLKVWSAACSTGAEPYTLAMVLSEFARERGMPGGAMNPAILATDISTEVLGVARLGIYPVEQIAPVPPALRKRYLLRARDPARETVRVVPALRAMARFGRLNLMGAHYDVDRDIDVIFCRNVLIYFDREGQAAVLRRLCDHLRPNGVLVLGHSETLSGLDLPVSVIGHTMFRRT